MTQQQDLQPGQKGYVEGEETPNPLYVEMIPSTRMSMRITLARELRSHLPLREAEQRVEELEAQLGELLQVIQTNAPYLLQGNVGGSDVGSQRLFCGSVTSHNRTLSDAAAHF